MCWLLLHGCHQHSSSGKGTVDGVLDNGPWVALLAEPMALTPEQERVDIMLNEDEGCALEVRPATGPRDLPGDLRLDSKCNLSQSISGPSSGVVAQVIRPRMKNALVGVYGDAELSVKVTEIVNAMYRVIFFLSFAIAFTFTRLALASDVVAEVRQRVALEATLAE